MECDLSANCWNIIARLLIIGLSDGSIIALNAIGVTLVYGVVRTINFAYGDLFSLMTALVAWGVSLLGLSSNASIWTILAGMLVLAMSIMLLGATSNGLVERVVFRPFRGGSRVAPLIAGIGMSFILYQLALGFRYISNQFIPGEHRSVPGIPEVPRLRIADLLPNIDLGAWLGLPFRYNTRDLIVVVIAAGFALLVGWILQHTRIGRMLRATSQDAEMARLCGVNDQRAIQIAFVIGGALAGAAAFVFTLYYTHPFTLYGAQSGLLAFTAAVLGGIGRPRGAFLAGLALGVIAALSDYFLAAQWTSVLMLGILAMLLLIRPTGLAAGESDHEPNQIILDPTTQHPRRRAIIGISLVVLAIIFPWLDTWFNLRMQVTATSLLISALLAVGLNLALGYAGILDLGYAASFAIGAYTTGIFTMPGSPLSQILPGPNDFLLIGLISAGTAALFGLLSSGLTLRLRGEYLAIVTLALGQMIPRIALNLDQWTGGIRGMSALPAPSILGWHLNSVTSRYYLVVFILLGGIILSLRLARSRVGRAWAALGMDESAAISCGIAPMQARTQAFMLSSALAGLAGALFAASFSYVDPHQSEFLLSAMVLAMVVIGGPGNVVGAVLGALLVAGYDQVFIPGIGTWLNQILPVADTSQMNLNSLRALNYLWFGLLIYGTTLIRSRVKPQS